MALKLSLKPDEKFVINGAVVQNGKRRTNLVLLNKVSILRQKDIMLAKYTRKANLFCNHDDVFV